MLIAAMPCGTVAVPISVNVFPVGTPPVGVVGPLMDREFEQLTITGVVEGAQPSVAELGSAMTIPPGSAPVLESISMSWTDQLPAVSERPRRPARRVAPLTSGCVVSEFSNSRWVTSLPSGFLTSIVQWPCTLMPSWVPLAACVRPVCAAGCACCATAADAAG